MKKILFFSNNNNKQKEIRNIFYANSIKIFSPSDFFINNEPLETGKTFEENSSIKSDFGYTTTNIPCFADDSGICIEALNGKPGLHSKKFIDSFKNKNDCFRFIFDAVKKTGKESAYYKTSISLTIRKGVRIFFNGKINGKVSKT